MATANIIIQQADANMISQSRDDLVLNVLVTLINQNNTGITAWLWQLIDKPHGSTAALTTTTSSSSTFVPDVEGTYLIKLTVNNGVAADQKGAAVKTANLHYRIPAASEDGEFDPIRGWASAVNAALSALDDGYGNVSSGAGSIVQINTGTGLTGGPIVSTGTISIDGTVATLTGSQTLTNKTISGSNNTLTSIDNSSLSNSSITIDTGVGLIGGSAVSLGSSITLDLSASGVTAANYGPASIIVDAYGRITSAVSIYIDLSTITGYSTSDIGPALQIALNIICAASNPGGTILFPPTFLTLVTPVSANVAEGNQITLCGIPGKTVIIPNCGDTNDAIRISHGVSVGNGSTISLRDLIIGAPAANTFSCRRFFSVDQNANSTIKITDVKFIGTYARRALMRLEDGAVHIDRLTFAGTVSSNGRGLLQLWQTYDANIHNISYHTSTTFNGVSYAGEGTAALVEWQAPQEDFSNDLPDGSLAIDGLWCDGQVYYACVLNFPEAPAWTGNTDYEVGDYVLNDGSKLYTNIVAGTSASSGGPTGTSANIADGGCHWKYLLTPYKGAWVDIRNAKITTAGQSVGYYGPTTSIYARNISKINIENVNIRTSSVVQLNAVEFRNVSSATVKHIITDTSVASANVVFADSECIALYITECTLSSVNSSATKTNRIEAGVLTTT